jgi:hypothetical protein
VKVTKGVEFVGHFRKTDLSDRQLCTRCGGHLMTDRLPIGLTDVCAATIPSLAFKPGVHVNCVEAVLRMKDGLPTLKNLPPGIAGGMAGRAAATSAGLS